MQGPRQGQRCYLLSVIETVVSSTSPLVDWPPDRKVRGLFSGAYDWPLMSKHLGPADYLKKILTARVYDVAVESQLQPAKNLSRRLHNKILLKREDQQPVFSFKLRGAYNKMVHLTPKQLAHGVICASAGNHAQGVAMSAHKLGTRAVIVMPVTTPQVKVEAVKALGGEVVLHGESYSDAYLHAVTLEKKHQLAFVHP